MATWLLVDGNSLTYRAFYALPTDIATSSGQVTNAVYGFTSMLVNLIREQRPERIVVAFDRPEPTFRHEAVETYKAQREAAPDILHQQVGLVREVLAAFGIPVVEVPGYEADDVLATLAVHVRDRGETALVVTGDRDIYQVVEDPHVVVLYTHSRGVSELKRYDEAAVQERTGVPPSRYVLFAALRGDPSDNLPGVPGVGEKTAAKLVVRYGDVDEIYAHVDEQSPKLRSNLLEHEAQVRTNLEVMRLVRDVPLGVEPAGLTVGTPDTEAIQQLFTFLEFRSASFRERLAEALAVLGAAPPEESDDPTPQEELTVTELHDARAAVELLGELARGAVTAGEGDVAPVAVGGAWEGDDGRSPLLGVALVANQPPEAAWWLPVELLRAAPDAEPGAASDAGEGSAAELRVSASQPADGGAGGDAQEVRGALASLLGEDGPGVVAHGAKALVRSLADLGIDVRGLRFDTMIAAYLLDPGDGRYALADVVDRHGDGRIARQVAGAPAPTGAGQLELGGGRQTAAAAARAAAAALATAQLLAPLADALAAQGLRPLNDEVEVPLVRVLARMEAAGVAVDRGVLEQLNGDLAAEAERLEREIWRAAGEEFNVNSTPQLREVLFTKLGLTPQRRTKTGYSTDAASLEKLRDEHPVVEHLLAYREVEKLRSTYAEGLLAEVGPDGRIHATFQQTVARTGRLSSEHPNLHNIPVRTEVGRAFRTAFVAPHATELLVADYDQIELRCIAHLAEDPGLIAAFEARTDIHTETAARLFGVDADAVSVAQRSTAKMVSYGLAYGMEAYGLAQRLGVATSEAQEILDAYFEAFPAVRDYMDRTVAEARERGYTETLFGRRRRIPELSSSNHRIRQAGERQAMNAGIQGLAADIFKVALVRLDARLERDAPSARLVLQVHDEVLVEVPADGGAELEELVREEMAGAFDLRVPLLVSLSRGGSWADAKG